MLATDGGGINRFDRLSGRFEYIRYETSNESGLNSNGIWCFHRDREGILWIGTSGGGINYFNRKNRRFKLFTHYNNSTKSLSYNFASTFFEDHEGMIWIGTDGGGINVYNPGTGDFKVFKNNPADPSSISGNIVRGIVEDKDNNMWIGTWEAGLNKYDRKTGRFVHYMPDDKDSSAISGRTIRGLSLDHNNTLWISIYNTGIDLLDTKKGVIKRFRPGPAQTGQLSSNNVWFFFKDNTRMWICTQIGLNLYDSQTNSFKLINFPDNDISTFYKDKNGYIWVGTNTEGLFLCNQDGTILRTYNINNILPDNRVLAITEDNKENIWISTNSGISRLNTKIQKIRSFNKDDGLQGDQFYHGSFVKTRSGEMYFGGFNGFNSFFPDSLKENDYEPPVYITDFQIFNKSVTFTDYGSQFPTHISETPKIVLSSKQSVFSFSFAAINYTHPEKNQYKYIMEGFEKEWNYTDASRRYVTYTNLDPGEYTFKVDATNNDAIWSDRGVSLKIVILPPWWRTWWFRSILVVTVILIFVLIMIFRVKQLKNQKELLEKTVAIKTAELNELNASKDKFFSIIAHDLKNPFNTIIGFSEMLNDDISFGDFKKCVEHIGMIYDSSTQTFRLLENLLEWANSQSGKISFNPTLLNLIEIFQDDFKVLSETAIRKNIELINHLPDDLTIIADKNMIKTILRNLISNALKFTNKNGKVEVWSTVDNIQLEISVSDSGIGMTKDTISKLFRIDSNLSSYGTENEKGTGLGLILCKEFVGKHGGNIWVESEPDKGSIFRFTLPLNLKSSQ